MTTDPMWNGVNNDESSERPHKEPTMLLDVVCDRKVARTRSKRGVTTVVDS